MSPENAAVSSSHQNAPPRRFVVRVLAGALDARYKLQPNSAWVLTKGVVRVLAGALDARYKLQPNSA